VERPASFPIFATTWLIESCEQPARTRKWVRLHNSGVNIPWCTSLKIHDFPVIMAALIEHSALHWHCILSARTCSFQPGWIPYQEGMRSVISHIFALLIQSSGYRIGSDPIHRSIPDPLREASSFIFCSYKVKHCLFPPFSISSLPVYWLCLLPAMFTDPLTCD